MKIRTIAIAAAAALLALVGCNKEIDYGPAKVEVDQTELQVAKEAGSVTVNLDATIDWAAKVDTDDADWLDISPAKGGPSLQAQTLTIKFTENTGINREATILVQGDVLHKTYINVFQAGPKGDEDTCTIAEFIQKADTQHQYVLTGTVSNVFTSTYTTFNINDESGSILVYSFAEASKELAATVKNGGTIKLKGTYAYYESKSQHEVTNAEILSYEDPAPIDPDKLETLTVKEFLDKADANTTYKLVGNVTNYNATYNSFNLKDATGSIYVYSIDPASKEAFGSQLANGKQVTLYGNYYWYENSTDSSKSKAEIMNAVIVSVEEGQPEDYSKAEPKTVAEFLAAKDTDNYYKLTGTVSGFNSNYCSFDLTDATGKVYVYSVANKSEWSSKISNGGTVTLAGKYAYYSAKDQDEVVDAYIISFEEGQGGGDDYENAPAKTVDEFLAAKDEANYYKLTGTVSGFNSQYCSFDLTDATGKVYVYSVKNKSEWSSKISNGGTVTLAGKYAYYSAKNQDEVVDAYILSFTAGEGGGEGGDDYENAPAKTVDEFLAAKDEANYYKLTGTVSGFNSQYCSFDLTDATGKVYVYSVKNKSEWSSKISNGGTVTLAGKYAYYSAKNQDEVVDAYILSFTAGEGGGEGGDDYENAPAKTVDEFLAAKATDTYYKLTGTVSGFNSQYCSFDLTDATGKIYVYSVKNKSDWSSKIKDGGTVTLAGKYSYYSAKDQDEVVDAYILSFTAGEGGGEEGGGAPTEFTKVTIAEFLAAPVSTTKWYQLTGVITNIANTTYGNFTIKDDTGEVYIYGLTKSYVEKNDQSFASLGLKKGDTVTLNGLRGEYQGTIETAGTPPAFYVSHTSGEEEKVPEGTVTLTFPDDNSGSNGLSSKQYETEWTAKIGSNQFKIFAFNNNAWKNNWTYIRCGRKADPSVATIATATPIASKVGKVVVTFDTMAAADVNSIKVITASDAGFTKDVAEVSAKAAQGDVTFTIAAPAANMYYKLVVDCNKSTASTPKNGFVQVSKVAYVAAE